MNSRRLARGFAAILLLLAVFELAACELTSSEICSARTPVDGHQHTDSGDNCLCCCYHIIPVQAFSLARAERIAEFTHERMRCLPLDRPSPVYHPPRG
jgi:hypothetical protein